MSWFRRQATPIKALLILAAVFAAVMLLHRLPAPSPIGPDRTQPGGHGL